MCTDSQQSVIFNTSTERNGLLIISLQPTYFPPHIFFEINSFLIAESDLNKRCSDRKEEKKQRETIQECPE
jgi:hypothetical protein